VSYVTNIVVLFPRAEEAKNIRNILVRKGHHVIAVCTTGSGALSALEGLEEGIIVCGYRFADMICTELKEYLPPGFSMLLLAMPGRLGDKTFSDIICLPMPLKVHELISTLEMMEGAVRYHRKKAKSGPVKRTEEEKKLIAQAKVILIEKNNMTENEAHRYIQKSSMDSGRSLIETAQMIISIMT